MPPHSLGSGTISFGLVSIPVKLYTAASAGGVSFNQLHVKCGNRLRQQMFCPVDNEVVDRSQIVKGYEFAKDQYVRFTDEKIQSLEGEGSKVIYFDKTYYLGPDKGGEKPYRLLADAMTKMERVALAKYVMRGKESLVLIRPSQHGLMLHTMYFVDEVRDFGEVGKGESATLKEGELGLAERLIQELSHDEFKPEQYQDDYRQRVLDLVNLKVEGKEVTTVTPEVHRAQVIDLMDALKQSLAKRVGSRAEEPERKGAVAAISKKPPVKAEKRAAGPDKTEKKAQAGRK